MCNGVRLAPCERVGSSVGSDACGRRSILETTQRFGAHILSSFMEAKRAQHLCALNLHTVPQRTRESRAVSCKVCRLWEQGGACCAGGLGPLGGPGARESSKRPTVHRLSLHERGGISQPPLRPGLVVVGVLGVRIQGTEALCPRPCYTFSSDALRSSLLALRHGGEMEAEVAAPVLDATMESVLPTVSEEEIAKKVRRIPPQKPPHRTRT
jgi:hypothetical protein